MMTHASTVACEGRHRQVTTSRKGFVPFLRQFIEHPLMMFGFGELVFDDQHGMVEQWLVVVARDRRSDVSGV